MNRSGVAGRDVALVADPSVDDLENALRALERFQRSSRRALRFALSKSPVHRDRDVVNSAKTVGPEEFHEPGLAGDDAPSLQFKRPRFSAHNVTLETLSEVRNRNG